MTSLTWMAVPGSPEKWRALGFAVEGNRFALDSVVFDVGLAPSWGFDPLNGPTEPLGVDTVHRPATANTQGDHPNLVTGIDHVVYAVPDLDAAIEALDALGLDLRRRFHPRGQDGPEMAFFRAGPTILEVVAGPPNPGLWGIAFLSDDLDATVAAVRKAGGPIGDAKPAVQGGRIAGVWSEHVDWGVAIMEAPVGAKA